MRPGRALAIYSRPRTSERTEAVHSHQGYAIAAIGLGTGPLMLGGQLRR
jgi:hypothetical protein